MKNLYDKTAKEIENHVRGLSPYPAAIADFYNESGVSILVKIFNAHAEIASHQNKPGKIETDNKSYLKIYLQDGWIFVNELQVSGKNRMPVKDFLNGFKLTGNWEIQ